MAETMQFDLVSPERRLASLQARAVQIPGADGDMTAMPDHAATITTMRPGILKVEGPEGNQDYVVTGGFAEINAAGLSVLAEKAVPVAEMTRADMDALVADAQSALEAARSSGEPSKQDEAAKLVADLESISDQLSV